MATYEHIDIGTTEHVLNEQEWVQLCRSFGNGCALCGGGPVVPDLVVPRRLGGTSDISNIQPLCIECRDVKRHVVDYRPFEPRTRTRAKKGQQAPPVSTEPKIAYAPKMITQRHLLAIESHQEREANSGAHIEDPIVGHDIERLLIGEIRRLRALIVDNPSLAQVESMAWKERYANLTLQQEARRTAGGHDLAAKRNG